MMAERDTIAVPIGVMLVAGLMLASCSTFQSTSQSETASNQDQVLNTTETAPADLQLTCSSAAANQFGLPPDKVLPVSSSKLPDGTYDVRLTSEGRNFICLIDENAAIVSMSAA